MEEAIDAMQARPPFRGPLHAVARARRRRTSIPASRAKPSDSEMLRAAEDFVREVLEGSPADLGLLSNLAKVLTARGDSEGARGVLLELREKVPDHLEWRTRLALSLAQLEQFEMAETMLAEIVEEEPEKDSSHVNLGFVLRR
jgi:Flp pilus assembly protein TadD